MVEHVRAQWARVAKKGDGSSGFMVRDVRPWGRSNGMEGTVVRGVGYRVIGAWLELHIAAQRGWYRSEGTYTVLSEEGRTQFASDMDSLLKWFGGGGRANGKLNPVAIIEVDLTGLPFRMMMGFSDDYWHPLRDGVGVVYPDVGTGLGIEGRIPLSAILAVNVVEDRRVVERWGSDWEQKVEEKFDEGHPTDNPGALPEVYNYVETWRAWVGLTASGNVLHRYLNSGDQETACGKANVRIPFERRWLEPLGTIFYEQNYDTRTKDPKTGKRVTLCEACWKPFYKATRDWYAYARRVNWAVDDDQKLRAWDQSIQEKLRLVHDPSFMVTKPKSRW